MNIKFINFGLILKVITYCACTTKELTCRLYIYARTHIYMWGMNTLQVSEKLPARVLLVSKILRDAFSINFWNWKVKTVFNESEDRTFSSEFVENLVSDLMIDFDSVVKRCYIVSSHMFGPPLVSQRGPFAEQSHKSQIVPQFFNANGFSLVFMQHMLYKFTLTLHVATKLCLLSKFKHFSDKILRPQLLESLLLFIRIFSLQFNLSKSRW